MATIETDRRVDAFVMHGHIYENFLEDYADLLQKIEAITPSDRCLDQGERQLSLPTVTNSDRRVHLVAYEDDKGVNPLIFNIDRTSHSFWTKYGGSISLRSEEAFSGML